MLLNHPSPTVQSSSPTSESFSYPSLQSPSLPTDPSTCSHHVPVTELGDRIDSLLMLLNHRSLTVQSSSPTSEPSSYPSLQSPSLSTDPSTYLRHVPVTELGERNDSQLMMLLNHPSPTQSSSTSESSSCPSLQSFTRPTNPLTHSRDVSVTERSGRNDSHLMLLTSNICFSSPNTSTQSSPDRPIDAHCVGHNLPPHSESRDSDEVPQQYVYYPTHQNPEYSWYYSGLPNCWRSIGGFRVSQNYEMIPIMLCQTPPRTYV